MRVVLVPLGTFSEITEYLKQQPWAHVNGLLPKLNSLPIQEVEQPEPESAKKPTRRKKANDPAATA